jgi:hypothetical protein
MQLRKSNKKPLELTYDNLIIGSNLEAVLFSYQTQTPLLSARLERPLFFESMEDFGIGTSKLEAWEKYIFLLSLSGLVPFSDKIKFIRYMDANKIRVVTHSEKVLYIKFNQLFIFDDYNFYDLPAENGLTTKDVIALDWFKIRHASYHQLDSICREDKFINKILFYTGTRHILDKQGKDCLVISNLTQYQADSDKYAEYVVKVKLENILRENGIVERDKNKMLIEHIRRDIIKLGRNSYDNFENVLFVYTDPKTAWEFGRPRAKINYLKYLKTKLGL